MAALEVLRDEKLAENAELFCEDATGITYNPLTDTFTYSKSVDVNYMIATRKSED